MKRWTLVAVAVMVMAVTAFMTTTGYSQARQGGRGGPGGGFDREAFRERMETMMKERLEASDEEWTVLGPRLRKVQDLRAAGMRGMGRMFAGRGGPGGRGGRGGPGGPPELPADAPQTVRTLNDATETLADLVEQDAGNDDLKAALETLRTARRENDQALNKSQKELQEVLTLKQEATLVMMGMID